MNPLFGIGLWFLIFIVGGALGSFVGKKNESIAGIITQIVFIISSLIVFYFFGGFYFFGIRIDIFYSLIAFLTAFPVAVPLAYLTHKIASGEKVKMPIDINKIGMIKFILILLVLAPIGEEMLFRGVLETSMFVWGPWVATIVSAFMFAVIHLAPFKGSSKKFMGILTSSAFILGFLAGYFRAVSNSLLPAYIVHATFNASGKIIENQKIRRSNTQRKNL